MTPFAVAVMVAVPSSNAVILPLDEIVTTSESRQSHVAFLLGPSIVAFNVTVFPLVPVYKT